jgi:hypothetical protein
VVMLLKCILEVFYSNLGRDNGCSRWHFSWFSADPSGKCRGITSSSPQFLPSNSLSIRRALNPSFRRCTTRIYRVSQEERSIFREVIQSVILRKKVYMCPIPNGFWDTAISLYSSKIVDKKEILRTVSNTGIYCSSANVGTVHHIFENSTFNINVLCNSCDDRIEHISIFGICEDMPHFSQHSYSVTIDSHNGQLTLNTNSHAGGKDNIGRQIQTTLLWNRSVGADKSLAL